MMAREVRSFLLAIQFMTRLPVPASGHLDVDWLERAAKYFPFAGAVVGAIAGSVFIASAVFFPQPLPNTFALIAAVLVTGALHEDGLADTFDGLYGGSSASRRLEIMKDSSIGTYGALALLGIFALKFSGLSALDAVTGACVLIGAHATGRSAAVIAMAQLPYAGDPAAAKIAPSSTPVTALEAAIASGFALLIAVSFLPFSAAIAGSVAALAAAGLMALIARRRIGGYTGDILGAIEQVAEAAFICAAAAIIAGPG